MPFYCECAKILTLIEEYRLTILPSEVSKRWRVLSNDCHPAHRRKFFGETLNAAVSKAIDYETKRRLEKEANDGEIYASGKKAAEGEMMEDILRDVQAMISGNKQLRTAFRTMQAERDQLRAQLETASNNARLYADKCTALEAASAQQMAKERDAATARAEAAEGRADGLYRALCEAVKASGGIAREGLSDEFLILGVPAEMAARKKAQEVAESTAAGLRRALEEIDSDMAGLGWTKTGRTRGRIDAALAASPDKHERRIKAETLRATANELESLRNHIQTEIGPDDARDDIRRVCWNRAKDLRDEAERLEAPNGR